ncbi:MAG: glycine zipper domain-containing protein [Gammaproteobacteria bacterium]
MRHIWPAIFLPLVTVAFAVPAGEVDGEAVLGGALGGATGAAVGSAVGGREGAIIGAGVGGALGAAVGSHDSEPQQKVVTTEVVHVREVHHRPKRHDNGLHLGHWKHRHKHK